MHKPPFVNQELYHIYNRGVEKRKIFLNDFDYFRFIHDMFEFNDTSPAGKFSEGKFSEVQPRTISDKKRDMLVKIHTFCLMPNHYHFILEQVRDNGIILFMKKIGTGYSMYFNKQQKRVGALFQGRFKASHIENDQYFIHLARYIHLNPMELFFPNWKTEGIKDRRKSFKYLKKYRWSSYLDYIEKNNFPSIIYKNLLSSYFPNKYEMKRFVINYTQDDYNDISNIAIE